MTKPIQLHVGYVGVTREGMRVEITGHFQGSNYPWASKDRGWSNNGSYDLGPAKHCYDIVGPWVEATKTPINYNDGFWHQWHGGECPVHHRSTVELISEQRESVTQRRSASEFNWNHPYDPILVFRVTEEFVEPKEPRELWVSENDYQAHETEADAQEYDKALGHNHGYFRVKEVM
jgi:hypothetical protein